MIPLLKYFFFINFLEAFSELEELKRSSFSWTPNQKITSINMLMDSLWCADNEHMHSTKGVRG